MFEEILPFKKGNRVKVSSGPYAGQSGLVNLTFAYMTKYGLYAKVWVRFDTGSVLAFNPEHLLPANLANRLTATYKYSDSVIA